MFSAFQNITLSFLENFCLRVPNRNFMDFGLFNVDFRRRKGPSARWTSAANTIDGDNVISYGR